MELSRCGGSDLALSEQLKKAHCRETVHPELEQIAIHGNRLCVELAHSTNGFDKSLCYRVFVGIDLVLLAASFFCAALFR